MFDTVSKIKGVLARNRSKVKNMNEVQLVDFLWDFDCIRDRVLAKADILHFLKRIG